MLWEYPGVTPLVLTGCTCRNSHFDLDGFERCFVPAAQTCSVNVLDANGNLVMRIGKYGNADSRGKDSPVLDPKTGILRPRRPEDPEHLQGPLAEPEIVFGFPRFVAVTDEALYVADADNERLVRISLDYHAEREAAVTAGSRAERAAGNGLIQGRHVSSAPNPGGDGHAQPE